MSQFSDWGAEEMLEIEGQMLIVEHQMEYGRFIYLFLLYKFICKFY